MCVRPLVRFSVILCSAFLAAASPTAAQPSCEGDEADVAEVQGSVAPLMLTPVVWSVLAPVVPVAGTDGKVHLAYELHFTNVTNSPVRISSVQTVDPALEDSAVGENRVLTVRDEDVSGKVRLFARGLMTMTAADYAGTLPPGQGGIMYFSLAVEDEADLPCVIAHRVTGSQLQESGAQDFTAVGGFARVSNQTAVVLGPPLRGGGWVDGDGCCKIIGPHRFTILPSNGRLRPAEHFAIDFVRLDDEGRLFSGEMTTLQDWNFYGAEVLAAAPGRVVEVVDDLPDLEPGKLPDDATAFTAGGNRVIVDIGEGRYALYAHMIPGSITAADIAVGDTVEQGQVLGQLGNSGNTDGPHLHFQIMDAPSALNANGLPFVFETMALEGRLTTSLEDMNKQLFKGQHADVDRADAGPRPMQMPLSLDVVEFP